MEKTIFKSLFGLSILLNLVLAAILWLHYFNSPTNRIGVLTRDINGGPFMEQGVTFQLPKGLMVRDVSPQGFNAIDQFEPNRFAVVVTTDQDNVVNYNINSDTLSRFGNHYSMDYPVNQDRINQSPNE